MHNNQFLSKSADSLSDLKRAADEIVESEEQKKVKLEESFKSRSFTSFFSELKHADHQDQMSLRLSNLHETLKKYEENGFKQSMYFPPSPQIATMIEEKKLIPSKEYESFRESIKNVNYTSYRLFEKNKTLYICPYSNLLALKISQNVPSLLLKDGGYAFAVVLKEVNQKPTLEFNFCPLAKGKHPGLANGYEIIFAGEFYVQAQQVLLVNDKTSFHPFIAKKGIDKQSLVDYIFKDYYAPQGGFYAWAQREKLAKESPQQYELAMEQMLADELHNRRAETKKPSLKSVSLPPMGY